jgi:asparagine synthase (glutamine-hydrolysing)
MCGIAGFWRKKGGSADDSRVTARKMADRIAHRGPDDWGAWVDDSVGVALAHRRLSIVDLSSAGHQPMISASGRNVLIFNGEIYNHMSLREELGAGWRWNGHSDTETLLAGFEHWGLEATLKRSVGMFAIAVWDRAERRLVLARDRFGEKPLYYGWAGGAFVFGSELKALRCFPGFDNPVDRDVLGMYLKFCYVPAPYSIHRGIYKLEAGCVLTLSAPDLVSQPPGALFAPALNHSLKIERFWSFAETVRSGLGNPVQTDIEAVEQLEAALSRSVSLQSIADVPLGAFLSGGVDSSTIVALMQAQSTRPIRTFTIGFEDAGFNEAEYAKAVAKHLGTDHTELYVSPQQARDVIPRLPELYCEPFADSSQIPTFLVSQIARKHVTVSLSGDGGDELFSGYNRYVWGSRIWNRLSWMPPFIRRGLGQGIQIVPAGAWDWMGGKLPGAAGIARLGDKAHKLAHRLRSVNSLDDLYRSLVSEWTPELAVVPGARPLPTLLDDAAAVRGIVAPENRMMVWDALTYMTDDILCKVDRAAMGVSLETRVPFLDHRVVELAWRVPLSMKIRGGQGKWALRQVLYKHVPRELIERPKAGFGIPINQWLRGPLRDWAEDLLDESRLKREGYLNAAPVRLKWSQHLKGTHDWTPKIWAVLMFQAWIAEVSPKPPAH